MSERLIVSFTTYPARISNVPRILGDLSKQTRLPDAVVLYLCTLEFENIEIPFLESDYTNLNFSIRWVDENIRSHKKYYYAINEYKGDCLVLIDDDIVYHKTMLERLWDFHQKNPNDIIASRAHKILCDNEGELLPYDKWGYETQFPIGKPSYDLLFTGGGGTLLPPNCLHEDATNLALIKELAPYADDLWLNVMAWKKGTKVVLSEPYWTGMPLEDYRYSGLIQGQNALGGNDSQFKKLREYYKKTSGENKELTDIIWSEEKMSAGEFASYRHLKYASIFATFLTWEMDEKPFDIYGAGTYTRKILTILEAVGYLGFVKSILVTDITNNPKEILGIPVVQITEATENNEHVLIGTTEKYQNEIKQLLIEKGYNEFNIHILKRGMTGKMNYAYKLMTETVSCVVPVYNAEKYIKRTINYLRSQSFANFEAIFVDDCSTDNSFEILTEMAKTDTRIKVVQMPENGGAAKARNYGLTLAKGEYVIFLDSDDYFHENMLKRALETAVAKNADLVCFNREVAWTDLEGTVTKLEPGKIRAYDLPAEKMTNQSLSQVQLVPWNKLAKREFLLSERIEFQDVPVNNDVYFAFAVATSAKRVVVIDDILITYYRGIRGSLSVKRKKCRHAIDAVHECLVLCATKHIAKNNLNECVSYALHILENYIKETSEFTDEEKEQLVNLQKDDRLTSMLLEYTKEEKNNAFDKAFVANLLEGKEVDMLLIDRIHGESPLSELVVKFHKNNLKVAIWGAGKYGTAWVEELNRFDIKVDALIDSKAAEEEIVVGGYKAMTFEAVKEDIDIVLISVANKDVCEQIRTITSPMPTFEKSDIDMLLSMPESGRLFSGRYKAYEKAISVIMPVFNTGDYLRETFESLAKQTFKNFEIICVDDYSNDEYTLQLLEEAPSIYKNVRVVKNTLHKGAANARNTGFAEAKGEYVIFLDSDDLYAPTMLAEMYAQIIRFDAQQVCAGHIKFEENEGVRTFLYTSLNHMRPTNRTYRFKDEPEIKPQTMMPLAPWVRLCSKEFLEKNNIHFQNLSSSNDVFYSASSIILADKICYTEKKPLIFHRVNTTTQISANRDPLNVVKAGVYLAEFLKEQMTPVLEKEILMMIMDSLLFDFTRTTDEEKKSIAYDSLREYLNSFESVPEFKNASYGNTMREMRNRDFEGFMDCIHPDQMFAKKYASPEFVKFMKEELGKYNKVIIWGRTVRTMAIDSIINEAKLPIHGYTELNYNNTNQINNIPFIEETEIVECVDCIIACDKDSLNAAKNLKALNPSMKVKLYTFGELESMS